MQKVQVDLLGFLENEDQEEENYENLIKTIEDQKIRLNKYEMKTFLYVINQIANNHYRYPHFFTKIEQILKFLKKDIEQYYSKWELFSIFNKNKRIILFLIEENMITIDDLLIQEIIKKKYRKWNYPEYFSHEIKPFLDLIKQKQEEAKKNKDEKKSNYDYYYYDDDDLCDLYDKILIILEEDFNNFNEKRKKGENDNLICKIIQEDLIDEFITYVNQKDYPLKSTIEPSIFETNQLLLIQQKQMTFFEYSAFFGSVQIFKYLYKNGVELTTSLWFYAIHGYSEEIIHILLANKVGSNLFFSGEEEDIDYEDCCHYFNTPTYKKCIKECIKCHHNDFANYIMQNFNNEKDINISSSIYGLIFYNFLYFPDKINDDQKFFMYACKYDYFLIVSNLLCTKNINVEYIYNIRIFFLFFNGVISIIILNEMLNFFYLSNIIPNFCK